jgi:hypothetical protein
MKLAKLMNGTDALRKMNAKFIRVVALKKGYNKMGQATAIAKTYTPLEFNSAKTVVKSKDLNKYVSSITFLDKQLNVKVSCSCRDFLYRHEFILAQYGAADIIYGNGEPPLVTRQDNKPSMCKHLVGLRLLIKSQEGV